MSQPIPADQLCIRIADQLEPVVAQMNGKFSRARDPWNVLELLGNGPGTFRVVLHDDGDEKAGGAERTAIVKYNYKVTVSHNRGLPLLAGQAVSEPGTGPSLLEQCAEIRRAMLRFTFPAGSTGERLMYGGRSVVLYEGTRLDAYEMTFSLYAAI